MAKKKILTREEKMELVRTTFKEIDVATNVRAWTFMVEKQYYVVIKFFASRMGYSTVVYPSNRKGIKASNTAIYENRGSSDYMDAFEKALEILIPIEVEVLETEERTNL
jgi:hypothetical protein